MKSHFQIFNDIYINCKYHAILNMLNAFNVDVNVILYNYITIYKSSPQYNTYKPKYITTRNLQDILFENGILEEKIDYTLNLFEKIKECNRNDCCAIIRVDMYEIPYHKEYFKKKHYRRYVLLYDIDIEKGIVKILDREMNRSELHEKLKLSDRKHFRIHYLKPALEAGLIEMTKPEIPNSRSQKYRLTVKGIQIKEINQTH